MEQKTGIVIGRPVNGISLNGLEYALDDDGNYIHFSSVCEAKRFLRDNGVEDENELEDCFIYKHHTFCPECGLEHLIDPSDLLEDETGLRGNCEKCDSPFYVELK